MPARGKRRLQVADVMVADVLTLHPQDTVAELRDLMYEHNVRHVPVVDDDGELVGLVSHRDLLRRALIEQPDENVPEQEELLEHLEVQALMNYQVETVAPETELREAAQTMLEYKYGCLPVVEGRRLVGILTESDFVRLAAESPAD